MAAFIAHPSVRMKGTEHNYNPVLCQDETCSAKAKESHMHCPFCSITEAYQDPVILRAHYRVKHVDKGIDFAGLKVLRCCNHCEIVGTIKGEKKFKGAHWHCYRCRNGFNRRDEAIKHYKTHFRNPHTTFQIQITQEVNSRQYYEQSAEAHPKAYSGLAIGAGSNGDYSAIGPVLTQTIIATSTSTDTLLTEGPKDSSVNNGIAVGAEETVGLSQQATGQQTLVLMDPDGETGNLIYDTAAGIITEQGGESLDQSLLLEKQLLELHQQNQVLRTEKAAMEKRLRAEIQRLKDHMASLVQANVKMFEELQLYRTSESSEQKIKKLLVVIGLVSSPRISSARYGSPPADHNTANSPRIPCSGCHHQRQCSEICHEEEEDPEHRGERAVRADASCWDCSGPRGLQDHRGSTKNECGPTGRLPDIESNVCRAKDCGHVSIRRLHSVANGHSPHRAQSAQQSGAGPRGEGGPGRVQPAGAPPAQRLPRPEEREELRKQQLIVTAHLQLRPRPQQRLNARDRDTLALTQRDVSGQFAYVTMLSAFF
ncbi:mitotic-spindle organizing protein 2 isoform X2 [Anguilla rostrata]|uniref:mitotic-spindle organizing protein 2 isoform X2 n=1 Tax=Anguilla rostrata TaxID=7938 RepID=UPI0030CB1C09